MENRDYLKQIGEDCTADVECCNCDQREVCTKELKEERGIDIPS